MMLGKACSASSSRLFSLQYHTIGSLRFFIFSDYLKERNRFAEAAVVLVDYANVSS